MGDFFQALSIFDYDRDRNLHQNLSNTIEIKTVFEFVKIPDFYFGNVNIRYFLSKKIGLVLGAKLKVIRLFYHRNIQ